jgi:hypothetical protein
MIGERNVSAVPWWIQILERSVGMSSFQRKELQAVETTPVVVVVKSTEYLMQFKNKTGSILDFMVLNIIAELVTSRILAKGKSSRINK